MSLIACTDKLDDILNKYKNTYHRTIKRKPVDVKPSIYINYGEEINNKDPKIKIGDHVRISTYKNIFTKGYLPNWSEEVFVIKKKLIIVYHGHMLLVILKATKLLEVFTKRIAKNKSQRI